MSQRLCLRVKALTASRSKTFPRVWARNTARVRSLRAASSSRTLISYPGTVTSTKTGTRRFWKIGFTVVGKPAATVMTSSPGVSRRSPSFEEVRALRATRLAEEPELTSDAERTPTNRARFRSKVSANRPVVNQASRAESTTALTSDPSITLPDTGTGETPGIKSPGGDDSNQYCAVRSRICRRSLAAVSVIGSREGIQNHIIQAVRGAPEGSADSL